MPKGHHHLDRHPPMMDTTPTGIITTPVYIINIIHTP